MTPEEHRWQAWERKRRPLRNTLMVLLGLFIAVFIILPLAIVGWP